MEDIRCKGWKASALPAGVLLLLWLFGIVLAPDARAADIPTLHWRLVEPGLEFGYAVLPESPTAAKAAFVFLRIDPRRRQFTLGMASEAGASFSLPDWCRKKQLKACINAGMYLPDNSTSTGYMRLGDHINNAATGGKLGAFFVAQPQKKRLAQADILDRQTDGWRERLSDYSLVVQNYRLIDSSGKLLWPEGGPVHSIAAVAKDSSGNILFLLCQEPLTVERFAEYLRLFPLSLGTVMYVEGGAQAGIALSLDAATAEKTGSLPGASVQPSVDGEVVYVWKGRQSLLNTRGNPHAVLPNIIGIYR